MVQVTLATISKFLTDDVIDKVFKLKTNSEDNVQSIEITRAAPAGEGLISAVYRIQVTGKNHSAKFVAKGSVNDPAVRKSLNSHKFFKREVLFFSTILPILCNFQKSSGAKERIEKYIPVFYGCHIDGANDYILLEDMSESQCSPISEHPSQYESDMILKTLAHFHALSLALRIKKPDTFAKFADELKEVYYNDNNQTWYAKYLEQGIEIDKNVIKEFEDPESVYYQKFNAVVNTNVYERLIRTVKNRGDHPVFNHGDAWCSNFLCCNDKAVIIDFQLLRCVSPACDLAYFLIMSSNINCNKEEFFKSVDVYYKSLQYYLSDMGVDATEVFSLKTLKEELKEHGLYGFLAAITSIPLLANERCDNLQCFEMTERKYSNLDRIPLAELWPLNPIKQTEYKMRFINAVRVAVDVGLI